MKDQQWGSWEGKRGKWWEWGKKESEGWRNGEGSKFVGSHDLISFPWVVVYFEHVAGSLDVIIWKCWRWKLIITLQLFSNVYFQSLTQLFSHFMSSKQKHSMLRRWPRKGSKESFYELDQLLPAQLYTIWSDWRIKGWNQITVTFGSFDRRKTCKFNELFFFQLFYFNSWTFLFTFCFPHYFPFKMCSENRSSLNLWNMRE